MNWLTAGFVGLLFLSILVSGGFSYYICRRKNRWKIPLLILFISIAIWSFGYAMEILSPSLESKVFWAQIEYIGISFIPVGWFLFVQFYLGHSGWENRRRSALLVVVPLLTILLVFTNDWHGWIWKSYQLSDSGALSTLQVTRYGWWWWLFLIFAYGLFTWGSFALLHVSPRMHATFRWQFAVILVSLYLPWFANLLYLTGLSPIQQLDFSPVVFTLSAVCLSYGISRFRLFDLNPIDFPNHIHTLDTAAIVIDRSNRIIEINPAAEHLINNQNDGSIGFPIEQVFPWWDDLGSEIDEIQQEIPIHVDGLKHFFNIQITPILGKHGDSVGQLLLFHDQTGEKMASEAIALAQIKTEFLAKVSHELRSPLTSILGLTEMLDYGVYGALTDPQREAVHLIFNTTQQMTRLVNDLLQQSKLERGTFRLDITQFQVTDLMNRLSDRARSMAKSKSLEYSCEISPEMPPEIYSDSLRLYQIYLNLVENAIKYTHQGAVNVRVYKLDERRFAFQVRDTGMGIPEELQQLIFNPFQRITGDSEPDRKESGFGLGLSIVKQLVSLMDGEIRVTSEIGKGSCFEVAMPFDLRQENQG